jgi:hypothetical protein
VKTIWPALLSLAVALLFAGSRLARAGGDPMALVAEGTRFSLGDPAGSEGYDGQFAYYIARDWAPDEVAPYLDSPAYRYQRILFPALSRVLSLGEQGRLPWALPIVNLVAHFVGTWAVAATLARQRLWPGYALAYGMWVGLIASIGLDLNEPLAYSLVAVAIYFMLRERWILSGGLFSLALFAKETTLFFFLAALVLALTRRHRPALIALLTGGAAFAVWQAWLFRTFGEPGLGSGGAGATAFEWVPYMGFLRIASADIKVFFLFALVFGSSVLIPSIWGVVVAGRGMVKGEVSFEALALVLNAGVMAFLPFSTYREPLGLVRFSSGMVLAVIAFCAALRWKRPLNYAMFWIAWLVLLVPQAP